MTTETQHEVTGQEQSFDDWMDKEDSSRGAYLRNWKEDGEIKILLHKTAPVYTLYRHPWFVSGRKGKVRMVRFNSMESAAVNKDRNFRNDDGSRQKPPTICPFALTLEWVYEQIQAGKIPWTADIFEIQADDDDSKIIKAGGYVGLFGKRDLSDAQKRELREAHVKTRKAYEHDCRAQEELLFTVVEYDNPSNGPVVAFVKPSLDKAFREELKRRKKEFADDVHQADPRRNPVVFEWSIQKRGDGSDFTDFKVAALPRAPISPDHLAAIAAEPPSTARLREVNNIAILRQQFEESWCFKKVTPPWDKLFEPALKAFKGKPQASLPEDFNPDELEDDDSDEDEKESASSEPEPKVESKSESKVEPEAPAGAKCDSCGKIIPDSLFDAAEAPGGSGEVTCPHCSTIYAQDKDTGEYKAKPKPKVEPKAEEPVRASRRRTTSK